MQQPTAHIPLYDMCYFKCFIALPRNSNTRLNKTGVLFKNPCLLLKPKEKGFNISL